MSDESTDEKIKRVLETNNQNRLEVLTLLKDDMKFKEECRVESDKLFEDLMKALEAESSDEFFKMYKHYFDAVNLFYVDLIYGARINPFHRPFDFNEAVVRLRNTTQNAERVGERIDWLHNMFHTRTLSLDDVRSLIELYSLMYEDICYVDLRPIAQNLIKNQKMTLSSHLQKYQSMDELKKISNGDAIDALSNCYKNGAYKMLFEVLRNTFRNPEGHKSYDLDAKNLSINFINKNKIETWNFTTFALEVIRLFFLYAAFDAIGTQIKFRLTENLEKNRNNI
ncbi:MAG: hypothetical protein Q7S22_02270 [Candidatus Micrarchaeota archaeon]|nr:hypothetical protein [Candidatus Micrarchaeota archaeon]